MHCSILFHFRTIDNEYTSSFGEYCDYFVLTYFLLSYCYEYVCSLQTYSEILFLLRLEQSGQHSEICVSISRTPDPTGPDRTCCTQILYNVYHE